MAWLTIYGCFYCLQERGELIPPEDAFEVARKVKENYCYTCSDIVKVSTIHFFYLPKKDFFYLFSRSVFKEANDNFYCMRCGVQGDTSLIFYSIACYIRNIG